MQIWTWPKKFKEKDCTRGTGLTTYAVSQVVRGIMVKALDSGIVVNEFKLQSHYYVHFRTNTIGKSKNTLLLPSMC